MAIDENKDWDREIENGLKRSEIEEKFGAKFSSMGDLPLEIKSAWLKSIEAFEEQHVQSNKIKVWDYIGKPGYKKPGELKKEELPGELERLFYLLGENNISLTTLCEVDDQELYRFIIEELFICEINDIRVEGMMTCFIYEDFHPNAGLDIEHAFDYFFDMTLAKVKNYGEEEGYDMLYVDTENYEDANGTLIPKENVIDSINRFLASFDRFSVLNNEILSIHINDEKNDALLKFKVHYQGLFENIPENADFKGDGSFKLRPGEYGGWSIYHINLPGLQVQ